MWPAKLTNLGVCTFWEIILLVIKMFNRRSLVQYDDSIFWWSLLSNDAIYKRTRALLNQETAKQNTKTPNMTAPYCTLDTNRQRLDLRLLIVLGWPKTMFNLKSNLCILVLHFAILMFHCLTSNVQCSRFLHVPLSTWIISHQWTVQVM